MSDPLAQARQRLHDFIEREHAAQTAFLAELVRVPSDNPPGDCRPHAERTAALLDGLGLSAERHAVPEGLVREYGMVGVTNLIVRHRLGAAGAGGPVVALNAHGDVVPPGAGWSHDPYGATVEDGRMYGRGVAVSKSDFATYTWALRALQAAAADVPLAGTVELHLTYDEEAGGFLGPAWLLAEGLSRPDWAISAGFAYSVVTAHNGCLHLEVTVRGRSAHAARPDTGHDALEAATAVLNALYAERDGYAEVHSRVPGIGSPSLVVGLIRGGINTNVVPDEVVLRLDRRMIPEEDADAVQARLEAVVREAAGHFQGIGVETQRILLARPFAPVPGSDRLASLVAGHAQAVLGEVVPQEGVPLYTDARHYAAAGVPTVIYGAGPRSLLEANAHRADENLCLDDLRRATHVVARTLLDLLHAGG